MPSLWRVGTRLVPLFKKPCNNFFQRLTLLGRKLKVNLGQMMVRWQAHFNARKQQVVAWVAAPFNRIKLYDGEILHPKNLFNFPLIRLDHGLSWVKTKFHNAREAGRRFRATILNLYESVKSPYRVLSAIVIRYQERCRRTWGYFKEQLIQRPQSLLMKGRKHLVSMLDVLKFKAYHLYQSPRLTYLQAQGKALVYYQTKRQLWTEWLNSTLAPIQHRLKSYFLPLKGPLVRACELLQAIKNYWQMCKKRLRQEALAYLDELKIIVPPFLIRWGCGEVQLNAPKVSQVASLGRLYRVLYQSFGFSW